MSVVDQQIPTGTWTLDKVHSHAGFSVKHMVVATYRSQFTEIDGTFTGDRLEGRVAVASIEARDENLKGHLLSPEFFDAENTPYITFVSDDIRLEGDRVAVAGDLTIKGITQRVEGVGILEGPAEDIAGATKLGIELETVVDRTQFGLNWNAPLPKGGFALANDVKINVHLEFVREEA
jgi:polyisoprenoid-binding protein YceI